MISYTPRWRAGGVRKANVRAPVPVEREAQHYESSHAHPLSIGPTSIRDSRRTSRVCHRLLPPRVSAKTYPVNESRTPWCSLSARPMTVMMTTPMSYLSVVSPEYASPAEAGGGTCLTVNNYKFQKMHVDNGYR